MIWGRLAAFILSLALWLSGRALVGHAIYRSRVQFPAGPLSRNIGQLSLASLWGR